MADKPFFVKTLNVNNAVTANTSGVFVGANVAVNNSTIVIGTGTINSTSFSGQSNTALTANLAITALTANNATNLGGTAASGYQTTAGLASAVSFLAASSAVTALTANNSTNLGGTAASGYQTTAGLSANVAGLTANNASNLGGAAASTYAPKASPTFSGVVNLTDIVTSNTALFQGTPFASIAGITGSGSLETRAANSTTAAYMTFHRPSAYASAFGLDVDNFWKVGGWSAGAVSYKLYHEGNPPPSGAANVQTFNSSGTWTKPATGTQVRVQMWGGGGGGGKGNPGGYRGGAGGGYYEFTIPASSLASTISVTVGAGGTGRTTAGYPTGPGGSSSFGSYATVTGGDSATQGNGGTYDPLTPTIAAVTQGITNFWGGGSSEGGVGSSVYGGGGGAGHSGAGGTSIFGGAGGNGTTGAVSPGAGIAPGGGGGGCSGTANGADGAAGRVIVTTY